MYHIISSSRHISTILYWHQAAGIETNLAAPSWKHASVSTFSTKLAGSFSALHPPGIATIHSLSPAIESPVCLNIHVFLDCGRKPKKAHTHRLAASFKKLHLLSLVSQLSLCERARPHQSPLQASAVQLLPAGGTAVPLQQSAGSAHLPHRQGPCRPPLIPRIPRIVVVVVADVPQWNVHCVAGGGQSLSDGQRLVQAAVQQQQHRPVDT